MNAEDLLVSNTLPGYNNFSRSLSLSALSVDGGDADVMMPAPGGDEAAASLDIIVSAWPMLGMGVTLYPGDEGGLVDARDAPSESTYARP